MKKDKYGGWRKRSYDDGEIKKKNEEDVKMNEGGGNLKSNSGIVRKRKVEKIKEKKRKKKNDG